MGLQPVDKHTGPGTGRRIMQVTIETTGTLERRMRVELPADRIEKEIETRLKRVGRTAKIKGFQQSKH